MTRFIAMGVVLLAVSLAFATNFILANNGKILEVAPAPTATSIPVQQQVNNPNPKPTLTFAQQLARPQDPNNVVFPIALVPIGIKTLSCKRVFQELLEVRANIFPLERTAPSIHATFSYVQVSLEPVPGIIEQFFHSYGTINSGRDIRKTFRTGSFAGVQAYLNSKAPIFCKFEFFSEKISIGTVTVAAEEK